MYRNETMGHIVKLAIPVVLGQITHTILNFADRFFIAKLGVREAAGAGLCVTLMWFLYSFTGIVSGGTIALVSRKIGEGDRTETVQSAEQSILLSIVFGIVTTLLFYFLSGNIFSFFKVESEVERLGLAYFRILLIGFPFVITIQTIAAIFQAAGDTRTPMKVFAFMSIINLIIDPFFIFETFQVVGFRCDGFGFGIQGAGYATIIAEAIAMVWLTIELYGFKKVRINRLWKIRPESGMIKRILRIGFWQGLNGFSRPLTAVILQRILAFHGTHALAAFLFGLQWITVIFLFYEGLKVAVSTLVGQNLGKKNFKKVEETISSGLILGNILLILFMVFVCIFAERAMGIFTNHPDVIEIGTNYLKIVLLGMVFSVPITIYGAAFNGAGDTKPPMIASFIANWGGKAGVAYLATYVWGFGVNSIWGAVALSIVIEGIGVYIWFKRGKWKNKVI